MAIERNAGSGGNFISQPGEYRVVVSETKVGLSKSKKPMLTVTFQTYNELSIRGYFVKGLKFHEKALEALKLACGLKVTDNAEGLVGKECGILVEAQEPDPNGRTFMSINGYGPAKDVAECKSGAVQASPSEDAIPF